MAVSVAVPRTVAVAAHASGTAGVHGHARQRGGSAVQGGLATHGQRCRRDNAMYSFLADVAAAEVRWEDVNMTRL
eukprot:5587925-Pleurochrysis_carterae.AAC.1